MYTAQIRFRDNFVIADGGSSADGGHGASGARRTRPSQSPSPRHFSLKLVKKTSQAVHHGTLIRS
jgi:hypothetical protein